LFIFLFINKKMNKKNEKKLNFSDLYLIFRVKLILANLISMSNFNVAENAAIPMPSNSKRTRPNPSDAEPATYLIPIHSAGSVLTLPRLRTLLLVELKLLGDWSTINDRAYFIAASKLHLDKEELERLTSEKNSLDARIRIIQAEILRHSQQG
jgi:hypothetical protein